MKIKCNQIKMWVLGLVLFLLGISLFMPQNMIVGKADAAENSETTITVTLNDGHSETIYGTKTVVVGDTYDFTPAQCTECTFIAWTYEGERLTDSTGSGGDRLWTIANNVELTAEWDYGTRIIHFDTGVDTVVLEDMTIGYMSTMDLYSKDDVLIVGYTFDGWYDGINGTGTKYADSDGTMIRPWDKHDAESTLYAKKDVIVYDIQYNLNGGTNSTNNPETYNVESESIELEAATKSGYRFMGWYDAEGTKKIDSIPSGSYGDIILTAQWEQLYTLQFSEDGYIYSSQNIQGVKGEVVTLPNYSNKGYTWSGYEMGASYTITTNKTFYLTEKSLSSLYNSSTGYYEIWTYGQLDSVRSYRSSKHKLMTSITVPEDTNWTPIPTFTGTFDGNNYWIKDLTIEYGLTGSSSTITRVNYGLFEENRGNIKNLGISQGAFGLYDYTATYSNVPVYCGFIAAKNSGTISYCEVLGSFFQFAYIAPYVQSISGSICGYNTGRVEYCEVFETGIQLTTGFGGGVVGHNKGGTITHCEIALSNVSCYQEFESDTEGRYTSGHYGVAGGIVGYAEGGTVSYCDVASNVDVDYNGFSSSSRSLAPELGIIAGRSTSSTSYVSNVAEGTTGAINGLNVITWTTGALWWKETHTWDQAQYVGGTVGRYV